MGAEVPREVRIQIATLRELLVANYTLKRLLCGVGAEVHLQIGTPGEFLVPNCTLTLLFRMTTEVLLQTSLPRELFVANCTLERFLSCVGVEMSLEIASRVELVAADHTLQWHLSRMVSEVHFSISGETLGRLLHFIDLDVHFKLSTFG